MKKINLIFILLLGMLSLSFGQSEAQLSVDDQQLDDLHSPAIELEPNDSMILFKFYVTNMNGEPQSGDVVRLVSLISKQVYSERPDSAGRFDMLLPKGDSIELRIRSLGRDSVVRLLVTPPKEEGLRITNYELTYSPPRIIILENVYYDTAKATLRPESFPSLNDLVALLELKPNIEMEIYGHTDNVGGFDYNIELSQNRAESVRDYLIEHGIDPDRLTAHGFGYTKPIDTNETPEGRQKNRRTEARILYDY